MRKFAAIPEIRSHDAALVRALLPVKENLERLTGQNGPVDECAVTLDDLIRARILTPEQVRDLRKVLEARGLS